MPDTSPAPLRFEVDGKPVEVPDDGTSLLDVLRERLGLRSPKDGCSPQGQCGCCTVLVDGQPRVACVTPARRVRGRAVTTLDGLDPGRRRAWGEAFCATGASQCGFCTPGIVVRLEALRAKGTDLTDAARVEQALLAHLCRCTGWRSILDAAALAATSPPGQGPEPRTGGPADAATAVSPPAEGPEPRDVDAGRRPAPAPEPARPAPEPARVPAGRSLDAASERAVIEGRSPQRAAPEVALGRGGFADDLAPADALVAVPDGAGGWTLGETLAEARAASGKVQGRRTTAEITHPIELPAGDWDAALRTTWVEPAYLELDASWCRPGGTPASPLANGGAFGGKLASEVGVVARELADRHGRPVRVVLSREDAARRGPKRPPVAGGIRTDGTGVLRIARTPGIAEAVAAVAPGLVVEQVDVPGPPTSAALRAAGWAEALVLLAGARAAALDPAGPTGAPTTGGEAGPGPAGGTTVTTEAAADPTGDEAAGVVSVAWGDRRGSVGVRSPDGAEAFADVLLGDGAHVAVRVACGRALDEVVLRSYCLGATHMALGWACSEALAVDGSGEVHDLTIRSFGVLRAVDTPPIDVQIRPDEGPPVNGSDAVFAAVAAATWLAQGRPTAWPTGVRPRTDR